MRILLTTLFVFIHLLLFAQFPVGHMSVNFKDASRTGGYAISGGIAISGNGRDVGTEIYYPAVAAGDGATPATGQFPVVVFGHGFLMSWDSYDNIYNDLAARGFIVALPRTEGGISPVHLDFGQDLAFVAEQVLSFNSLNTPAAIAAFNGKVKQKSALGGHSMGAGCSFVGAANNTQLTCLFNMAAATSNTSGVSSIASGASINVPSLVLSGERDCVADTSVQNEHYAGLASNTKFQVILKDITHCDFGNGGNLSCTFGQGTSGCSNTISNTAAFGRYMNYLVPFLNEELKEDCLEGHRFMDSISTPSAVRVGAKISGTIACSPAGIAMQESKATIRIIPSLFRDEVSIRVHGATIQGMLEIRLYDGLGRMLVHQTMQGDGADVEKKLNLTYLPDGLYLMQVSYAGVSETKKLIKR